MKKLYENDGKLRFWVWLACAGFCLVSAAVFLMEGDVTASLVCLGTVILVSIPVAVERFFGLRMHTGFFLFCMVYAMGPMLGKAYKLYYLTNWWDKLLHTSGGVVFAVVGFCLAGGLNENQSVSPALRAVFGLCFSIALSAVWELFEYAMDTFFAMDMQGDTLIHSIHSYILSDQPGVLYNIPDIRETLVNGTALPKAGYLDIGLIDTMHDVLVETLGAAAVTVWQLADRDRHPLLRPARAQ